MLPGDGLELCQRGCRDARGARAMKEAMAGKVRACSRANQPLKSDHDQTCGDHHHPPKHVRTVTRVRNPKIRDQQAQGARDRHERSPTIPLRSAAAAGKSDRIPGAHYYSHR